MSSGIVLASGTATLANTKLSLAANYSFFDIGVDLSQFIGNTIEITNATAPKYSIRGIISTVGTGETLSGSEILSGWTNVTEGGFGYETFTSDGRNITQAVNSSGYGIANASIGNVYGKLLKNSFTFTLTSGTGPRAYFSGFGLGESGSADYYKSAVLASGDYVWYIIPHRNEESYAVFRTFTGDSTDYAVSSYSLQQVLTPSATGHWIKSAPSATDGVAWSYKHASFNPNDSAGFTYRILSSNIPGQQIASGTVSATDVKLATVDGGSMVDITGLNFSDITDEGWIKKLVPTLWLRAEDLTATLGDGDAVTTWTDKMGSHNASQSTADNKPTLQTAEIGGKAVVRFDGSNDYFSLSTISINTSASIFVVHNVTDTTETRTILMGTNPATFKIYATTSDIYFNAGIASRSTTASTVGSSVLISAIATFGTNTRFYQNGAVLGSIGNNPGTSFSISEIGRTAVGVGRYKGDIAEIIIFNRALSDAERNQVEKSLSAYYGITLASSNPVPSSFVGVDSYSPPSTNLQLHLKADAGCYTDAGKTTACASDADKVYVWEDQSGNGNDAVQATEGYRPLWKTNIVGTLPAMRFGGVDGVRTAAFSSPLSQPVIVYVVAANWETANETLYDGIDATNRLLSRVQTNYALYSGFYVGGGTLSSDRSLFTFLHNTTSSKGYVNGLDKMRGSTGTNSIAGFSVGTTYSAPLAGYALTGDIYEILVYNAAHDYLTRTQIERYLAGKWGIPYTPTVYGASPAKYLLALYDSSGRVATGYVGAAGGGEATTELITPEDDRTFASDTGGWTKGSRWSIGGGVASVSGGDYSDLTHLISFSSGMIGKLMFSLPTYSSGQIYIANQTATTFLRPPKNNWFTPSATTYTEYFTSTINMTLLDFRNTGSWTLDNVSLQQVTDIATTGVHLHSTPNATDRKMSLKTTGFDPNAVTSYKIYALTGSTNIPLLLAENNLELQNEDGSYIYGKEA